MRTRRPRHPGRSSRFRPAIDGLEPRRLLAVTYNAHFVLNDQVRTDFTPNGILSNSITVGPDQNLWFAIPEETPLRLPQTPAIGVINSSTGIITKYPTTENDGGGFPSSVVSGPGGDLWFIGNTRSNSFYYTINSIAPTTGTINSYPITTPNAGPASLAVGSDGNLWFTDTENSAIGMFNPTTHATTEFPLADNSDQPELITPGPNGDLWFTTYLSGNSVYAIGDINPTSHAITLAAFPNTQSVPVSIAAGPDGNVWFNETYGSGTKIGTIDATTHVITEYAGGGSGGITTGPDGSLWSTGQGMLSEFNPTTHVSSALPLPSGVTIPAGGPTIVNGPGGNLWFLAQDYVISAAIVPANKAAITGAVNLDPLGSGTASSPIDYVTVYLDLNHDGKLDPGDPSTEADALGNYAFTGLTPGTYTVRAISYPGTIVTFPVGLSQSVTVAAGQVGTVGPFGIIPSSALLPLTYSATPFGATNPDVQTAEVNGVYRTILGRAPDMTGMANAVAYLKAGGALGQLANDLLTSVEYDTDCVRTFYENDLDRAPTGPEAAAGLAFLQGGGTQEGLSASIFGSADFSALFVSDTAFVGQLYFDILGRDADAPGLAYWVGRLGTGTTRAEVVAGFLDSDEYYGRVLGGESALILANTSADTDNNVALLRDGVTSLQFAVSLFHDPAYVARANATVGVG